MRYGNAVTAEEIIEQIKALPAEERAVVLEFINTLDTSVSEPPSLQFIDLKSVQAVAEKIFNEHEELFRKLAQ